MVIVTTHSHTTDKEMRVLIKQAKGVVYALHPAYGPYANVNKREIGYINAMYQRWCAYYDGCKPCLCLRVK